MVARLTVPTTEGDVPIRPSFPLQLSYEFHIRKKAFELVREQGHSLAVALRMAREDPETRTLRFVTLLGMEGKRRQDQVSLWRDEPPTKFHKGDKGNRARRVGDTGLRIVPGLQTGLTDST